MARQLFILSLAIVSVGFCIFSADAQYTDQERIQGSVEYRKIYVRNENVGENSTWEAIKAWLSQFTSAPNDEVSRFIECEDSTSTKMQVWSNGDIENAQNNYGGISDESLKQDIVDADPQSQWDDLKAMRFRKWRFKTDVAAKGDDARTCLGAVGQEMQAVSPGLVRTSTKRRVVTESILEEGETSYKVEHFDDGPPLLSISYSVLYMKGMVALQEAMRRIEALEAR